MKSMLRTAVAALALISVSSVTYATELRLSHQWSNKDIRHQVAKNGG